MTRETVKHELISKPKHQGNFMRITIVTLLMACTAPPAFADLPIYESFDYGSYATLIGKSPTGDPADTWFTLANVATIPVDEDGDHDVTHPGGEPTTGAHDYMRIQADNLEHANTPAPVGGKLIVPANTTYGNKMAFLPFTPTAAAVDGSRNMFFSFTLQLADLNAAPGDTEVGYFFAGFTGIPTAFTGGSTAANLYGGQVRIRLERDAENNLTNSGKYQLGFVKNNVSAASPTYMFTEQAFSVDETVHLVGQYEFIGASNNTTSDDVARLWVNPTLGGEGIPTPTIENATGRDISTSTGATAMRNFFLRANTAAAGNLYIDELRLGTTFADVTSLATPGMPGDFNGDLVVNGNDFLVWQRGGTTPALSPALLQEWKDNFGNGAASVATASIPEPSTFALGALAIGALFARRRMGA